MSSIPSRRPTLSAHTVLVCPGGQLLLGTPSQRLSYRSRLLLGGPPLPETLDPNQHGGGLLVLGEWLGCGGEKTSLARPTKEISAGATAVRLGGPGANYWKPGDVLILPDTRAPWRRTQIDRSPVSRTERVTVKSVSPDGRMIQLATPTKHAHSGNGNFVPDIGNLTRSVTVESADPKHRAHILVGDAGRADLSEIGLVGLGRTRIDPLNPTTNHIGRYALHFHHADGPFAQPRRLPLSRRQLRGRRLAEMGDRPSRHVKNEDRGQHRRRR